MLMMSLHIAKMMSVWKANYKQTSIFLPVPNPRGICSCNAFHCRIYLLSLISRGPCRKMWVRRLKVEEAACGNCVVRNAINWTFNTIIVARNGAVYNLGIIIRWKTPEAFFVILVVQYPVLLVCNICTVLKSKKRRSVVEGRINW